MAYANAATELAVFMNDHWIPGVVDQLGNVSALGKLLLKSSGSTGTEGTKPSLSKMVTGGEFIRRSVRHTRATTVASVSGYDVLPVDPNRKFDFAKFQWRTYVGSLPQCLDDMMAARGVEQVNDWMKEHINSLIGDVLHQIYIGLYNSTLSHIGQTQIKGLDGLRQLCGDDDGTPIWGGIDSSSFSWWAPGLYDASAYTIAQLEDPTNANYILKLIRTGADNCTSGGMSPTHMITTRAIFNLIEDTMIHQKMYTKTQRADIGYEFIDYRGMEIVAEDPDFGPSHHAFFLNLKDRPNGPAIRLFGREGAWLKLSDWIGIPNQLAQVKHLVAQCALVCDEPRLFGMYTSLGAT